MDNKLCLGCDEEKPWSEFYINKQTSRPVARCKVCMRASMRDYRQRNVEIYRAKDRERGSSRQSPNSKRRTELSRYQITPEQYAQRFLTQDGVCAVCGLPETVATRGTTKNLAVDHCHATGMVRGLLCNRCNLLLGKAHDDPVVLIAAAYYVANRGTYFEREGIWR